LIDYNIELLAVLILVSPRANNLRLFSYKLPPHHKITADPHGQGIRLVRAVDM